MQGLQVELARRHKAPKVCLTNGIFSFIKTPLFKGDTGLPNFLAPFLHVETVSESIVDSLYSGVDQGGFSLSCRAIKTLCSRRWIKVP